MLVGRRMTGDVITVSKDTPVMAVRHILQESHINQVPVVDGKRLVGIISVKDIERNSASPASSLSIHELNYILADLRAEQIMTTDVCTVTPDTMIEDAACLIHEKRLNSLPVVEEGDILVGIITTCDLLAVLLEFMGVGGRGARVELSLPGDPGDLEAIADVIRTQQGTLVSFVSGTEEDGSKTAIVRVSGADCDVLCDAFDRKGFGPECVCD